MGKSKPVDKANLKPVQLLSHKDAMLTPNIPLSENEGRV